MLAKIFHRYRVQTVVTVCSDGLLYNALQILTYIRHLPGYFVCWFGKSKNSGVFPDTSDNMMGVFNLLLAFLVFINSLTCLLR